MKSALILPKPMLRLVTEQEVIPQTLWHRTKVFRYSVFFFVALLLAFFCIHAFADDGTDILANTTSEAIATAKGTGMKWAYIIEGASAIAGYIFTKNLKLLGGIVVLAVFFNVWMHFVSS